MAENSTKYLNDPEAIYSLSFERVARLIAGNHLPDDIRPVIVRLVHACGMADIVPDLAFSPDFVATSIQALSSGCAILCDCEMVGAGITRRFLPAGNEIIVTLNDPRVPQMAEEWGMTRSAAATHLWSDKIEGSIIAIGNAPTCLFELLNLIKQTGQKPAAILGFPVGFVGAAESKAALMAADDLGCDYITLAGSRGGSALASAAVNALCRIAQGHNQ